jgi:hypothetical protein
MLNFGANGAIHANNFNNIGLERPLKRHRSAVAEREYTNTNMKPYIPGEVDTAATMFECMKYGNSYVYLRKPNEPIAAEDFPQERYESMAALLEHPGIYTWILLDDNRFIAGRAFTPGEIYSKHANLYRPQMEKEDGGRVGILAAGECRIEPHRKVVYNFLSGTYMKHIGTKYTQRTKKDYIAFYKNSFDNLWRAAGASEVLFIENPLLPTSVSDADIAPYLDIGYMKYVFDSKDACTMFQNEEIDRQLEMLGGGNMCQSRRISRQSRRRSRQRTVYKSRRCARSRRH